MNLPLDGRNVALAGGRSIQEPNWRGHRPNRTPLASVARALAYGSIPGKCDVALTRIRESDPGAGEHAIQPVSLGA